MSREGRSAGAGLRLLGSPVQLAAREGGSATAGGGIRRGRPRSAATRTTHTPELHERSRRPFSADTKTHACTIRNFLKNTEHRDFDINDYLGDEVKIAPPTTALLENHNSADSTRARPSDLYSNPSDHGSEDTFISLGTKIKAKAQINNRHKPTHKNYLKYRDIAKRESKEQYIDDNSKGDVFDFKVMISEIKKGPENSPHKDETDRNEEEDIMKQYESYFLPLESKDRNASSPTNSLAGRVSFGKGSLHSEVENAIDIYSRRSALIKQQLSLVEEESTQDLESMPSQPFSSLSPQASFDKSEDKLNNQEIVDPPDTGRGTYVVNSNDVQLTPRNDIEQSILLKNNLTLANGTRTYESFYDDFTTQIDSTFNRKNDLGLSSTVLNAPRTGQSQYGDIAPVFPITSHSSLPEYSKNIIKNIDKNLNVKSDGEQHSSLECIALENMTESRSRKLSPQPTCQWNESPRHSRLLCKEFFSIKESDAPNIANVDNDNCNAKVQNTNIEPTDNDVDIEDQYPQYLSNSISKAYTSKIIEDYKKEIQAIDNLHELTLKDIKMDCISPTPLNIDFMFDQAEDSHKDVQAKKYDDLVKMDKKQSNKKSLDKKHEVDVSKISTKELIQNYFRVKEGEPKHTAPKTPKKKHPEKSTDRKSNNSTESSINGKQPWSIPKIPLSKQRHGYRIPSPVHKKNNVASETQIPHSSRIDCVQNDKDVDSWMSISSSTPKYFPYPRNPHNTPAGSEHAIESTSGIVPPDRTDPKETNVTKKSTASNDDPGNVISRELHEKSTVLDIYSMLKEIEGYGEKPVVMDEPAEVEKEKNEENAVPKDNFMEIFTFLEKVEHSANEALSVVTSSAPQVVPKLEMLLRLPQTELAQRYVTAALQLEERSCCIALLQESLANHKEQMINKMNGMERQSSRNIGKVKQECEEAVKRHQTFIDQLISDKKTLNHRIEQLVDERRALEERWSRSAQALEQRYRLELKNQHDRMTAAQQVARQRWVRQKAEKIKELTVKGLEGELREMAERAAAEVSQLKLSHAEDAGRLQAKHAADEERLRRSLQQEHEAALVRERRLASSRMEKQIVELEATYAEQRTRLVAELRAENERAAAALEQREREGRAQLEKWRQEQEKEMEVKMAALNEEIARQREALEEQLRRKREAADEELEMHKRRLDAEQQREVKRRVDEAAAAHRAERDRDIERAIESMEAEAQRGRRDLQDALRRNKEQYETELKELGETERATLRRYQEAQARVRQTEDKCAELEAAISQLETRNRALTDKCGQLEAALEAAAREGAQAQGAAVAAVRTELDNLKRTHEEQMHQLYAKVKVAVARKDSAIQALTREADKAQEKITLLEQRLQQQRKDFLKHK